jgi:hypothetical protein
VLIESWVKAVDPQCLEFVAKTQRDAQGLQTVGGKVIAIKAVGLVLRKVVIADALCSATEIAKVQEGVSLQRSVPADAVTGV